MALDFSKVCKTPLYDCHKRLNAKLVEFAGWALPVSFSGLIAEHTAVRTGVGIFDVSHMGEFFVEGPQALEALQYVTCNNLAKIKDNQAQYTALTNQQGGIVDDLIIYRFNAEKFLLCVNAANTHKDFDWLTENIQSDVILTDRSTDFAQIAVQGPKAISTLQECFSGTDFSLVKRFRFIESSWNGIQFIAARTGYTGEDGFELFIPASEAISFWESLLETGEATPIGLGARDSLRLEACYPLHGNELNDDISAIESGLSWIVKPAKGDFIGRDVLVRHINEGAPRSLVGFFIEERGIARSDCKVFSVDGDEIGYVTSGTKTPTLNKSLGLALVDSKYSEIGSEFLIDVRGKQLKAKIVETPFYKLK